MAKRRLEVVSTPLSPAHPMGQGHSVPGGHYIAFRDQSSFGTGQKIRVIGGNLWRPHSPGDRFYREVLMREPKTVGDAIKLAEKHGFRASEVQRHLRWLYTASGAYLEIDGIRHPASLPPNEATARRRRRK